MTTSGLKYVLRNITRRDVNLGDLKIKIPAGKCRDLLGKKSRITMESIIKSEATGSISKYLGRSLIKVNKAVVVPPPLKEAVDFSKVTFPQRRKSYIIIDVGDVDEDVKDLVFSEDEEYLKQLEAESKAASGDMDVPVVAPDKE